MPLPPIEPPVAPPIDCQCLMEYPLGAIPGDVVATVQGGSYVYPSEYGLGRCDAHDATLAPYCDTAGPDGAFDPLSNPAWCSATWCFIDPSGCNVAYDDSTDFPGSGLYYSYDACESSNQFNDFYLAVMPRSPPQPAPPAAPAPPRPPPVPSPPPKRVLRFGYFQEAQPFLVACARGWFDTAEVEVICLPQSSGGYAVAKLDSGDLDLAVLGSTPWAAAISRGVKLTAFYTIHAKGESQGLVVRSDIMSPSDLQGKTIGTPFGSTAHQMLLFLGDLFEHVQFTVIDVPTSLDVVTELWDAGEIDGVFCWGGLYAHLQAMPGTRLLLWASTAARWGLETFNVVAARSALVQGLPAFLQHFSLTLAALDRSWMAAVDPGWHPTIAPGGPEGYLTSIGDVISPAPYATSLDGRLGTFEALQLFDFIDAASQLSCEWLQFCSGSDDGDGLAAKSADASIFLHGLKLLPALVPSAAGLGDDGLGTLVGLFASQIDAAPLKAALINASLALTSTGPVAARRGAPGADGNGSSCSSFASGELPQAGEPQALTATATARTFGDGAGGVDGRSYSDGLGCAWTVVPSIAAQRVWLRIVWARVWAGDSVTVHAASHRGLADVLLAKISQGTRRGRDGLAWWPPLSASGALYVRFRTDARSESFYNAASDPAEDGDGFAAEYLEQPGAGCSASADCSGQPCDAEGECACAEAGRGGADCSFPRCLGTAFAVAPGTLKSAEGWGSDPDHRYDNDAECVFVLRVADPSDPDMRLTVTHDLEEGFDSLDVYAGAGTGGVRYARLTGAGVTTLSVPATGGAATLHFASDDKGRRGGFGVAFASGRFASHEGCPVGAFGMDCAAQACMARNAPLVAAQGTLATGQPVGKLADCSWELRPEGALALRLNVSVLHLEAAAAAESADRLEMQAADGWRVRLWAEACEGDYDCDEPFQTGVCTAERVCAMRSAYDVPAASVSLRLVTDLNDGGAQYAGVVVSWSTLLACPVEDTPTAVQCLEGGGVCDPDGACDAHRSQRGELFASSRQTAEDSMPVRLNCSCAPAAEGVEASNLSTHPLVAEAGAGAGAVGAGVAAAIVVSLMFACVGLACRRRELELRMELAKKEMELGHQLQLSRATDEEKEAIRTELQQSDSGATSLMLRRLHIPLDDLSLIEGRLGAGSFGTVVQATWRGTPVAVKRLHRHRINAEALRQFKAECELLLSLRHPNIVTLLGGCWRANDATVCMVLEYCAGGSLSKALADTQARLTWTHHRLPIALGVARAMAYLHGQEPPVLHRDLKPANVLLDTTRTEAKVADFGLSREWREDATMSVAGTPIFSAPEVLRRERYSSAADVWSYGCVLSCLTTRTIRPFPPSASPYDLRREVSEGWLLPRAEGAFAEVVAQCTRPDVDERPSFAELLALLEAPQMAERVSLAEDSFARTVSSASPPSVRVACRSANAAAQLDGRLVVVDVVVTQ